MLPVCSAAIEVLVLLPDNVVDVMVDGLYKIPMVPVVMPSAVTKVLRKGSVFRLGVPRNTEVTVTYTVEIEDVDEAVVDEAIVDELVDAEADADEADDVEAEADGRAEVVETDIVEADVEAKVVEVDDMVVVTTRLGSSTCIVPGLAPVCSAIMEVRITLSASVELIVTVDGLYRMAMVP